MSSAGVSRQKNNFTPELRYLFQKQHLGAELLCDDKSSTNRTGSIDQQLTQQQQPVISIAAEKLTVSEESIIPTTTNNETTIPIFNAAGSAGLPVSQNEADEILSRRVILSVAGGSHLINTVNNDNFNDEIRCRPNAVALTATPQLQTTAFSNPNFASIFGDTSASAFQTPPNYFSSLAAAVSGLGAFQYTFQQTQLQTQQAQQTQHVQLPSFSAESLTVDVEKQKCNLKRKRFHQFVQSGVGDEVEESVDVKPKKIISPFAPEATVPLPFQLNEGLGTTVWKRNERERFRVRCVNEGYERLRNSLPVPDHERRLSKVDTLRLAIYYIQHLQYLLFDEDHAACCNCFAKFTAENDASAAAMASGGTGGGSSSAGSGVEC